MLRNLLLYLFAVCCTVFLGAWIFYSLFLERSLISYVRETQYAMEGQFNIWTFFYYLLNFLHSGWLPYQAAIATSELPTVGWANCSVVFPLVLVCFLFRRAENFWEFVLKWLVVVFLFNEILMQGVPLYANLMNPFNGHPLSKFHPAYHCFQVGLIAFFISFAAKKNLPLTKNKGRIFQRVVAFLLVVFYALLTLFCIFVFLKPGMLPGIVKRIIAGLNLNNLGGYPKDLLAEVISFNLWGIEKAVDGFSLAFYLLSALLVLVFLRNKWLAMSGRLPPQFIAGLLLLNGILLSWTVYPLNTKELVWKEKSISSWVNNFQPTDRFLKVLDESSKTGRTVDSFQRNWELEGGGPVELRVGLWSSPSLSISSIKSFCQKDVADFIFQAFNRDGKRQITDLRSVGMASVVSSSFLDLGAVSYYYSNRVFVNPPAHLAIYFKAKQLYVYKNLNAWLYFYLAERTQLIDDLNGLIKAQRGIAYLDKKDFFSLAKSKDTTVITLKEFSYGKLVFDYSAEEENLLVVADAWHPFWKAKSGAGKFGVCKVNGIFKGVKLPAGKYSVTLYFDTAAFYPGIIISIIAWLIFLSGWFVLSSTPSKGERIKNE